MSIVDRFGNAVKSANYSSTRTKIGYTWQRPRFVDNSPGDTFKCLNPSEKNLYHALARDLFRSSPTIRAAITRKNSWACASGWNPVYKGSDQDFGKLVLQYLNTVVLPNCNTAGPNYSFNRTLVTIANEIDVGGDCLIIFAQGRDGLLRMSLYPSYAIGQRDYNNVVTQGRYKGNNIFDGVVYDSNNTAFAFSILQDNRDEDYYVSTRNAQLVFEPEEGQMLRGVSVIAASLIDAMSVQDTSDNLSAPSSFKANGEL